MSADQDHSFSRRRFNQTAVVGALGLACGLPDAAEARRNRGSWKVPLRRVYTARKPAEVNGGPLELPPWTLGRDSSSDSAMLMFRGNPSHTFYGTGDISDDLKVIWKHRMIDFETKLRGVPKTWRGTGWTGQAAYYAGYVFIGSQGRSFYAFDAATGKVRWRLEGKRMFKSSPCFYENRLYVGNVDNQIRCIDAATGNVLWARETITDCDSSPCVVDDRLYICGEDGNARCLDPRTGDKIWETFLGGRGKGSKGGSNGIESSAAIADGELFAGSYDGRLFCVDTATGKIKWTAKTGDDTDASPVISGKFVYVGAEDQASKLYCFDRSQQGKLVWTYEGNRRGYWGTPALADGVLYAAGNDARLHAVDAKTGQGLWKYRAGAAMWSSPAYVNGKLVVGSFDSYIHMVDAKTGQGIKKVKLAGQCLSTPTVVDGKVYIGCSAGTFYCLG